MVARRLVFGIAALCGLFGSVAVAAGEPCDAPELARGLRAVAQAQSDDQPTLAAMAIAVACNDDALQALVSAPRPELLVAYARAHPERWSMFCASRPASEPLLGAFDVCTFGAFGWTSAEVAADAVRMAPLVDGQPAPDPVRFDEQSAAETFARVLAAARLKSAKTPVEKDYFALLLHANPQAPQRVDVERPTSEVAADSQALDRAVLAKAMKRHQGQIRYCYERALAVDPRLSGELVVEFTVARDGGVAAARVKSSSLGNADVESCIVGQFKRMQFTPPPDGVVVVTYPIKLHPR